MSVKRIYVEKKAPYAVEAKQLLWEIRHILQIKTVTGLRLLNRYDVEGVDDALYQKCLPVVFSEPQVDVTYTELPQGAKAVFAVEYLPGQYDQRAASCEECIQLVGQCARPTVRSARVYLLDGDFTADELARVKKHVINPVEAREADLGEKTTLQRQYDTPDHVETLTGFTAMNADEVDAFVKKYGLAMDDGDLAFCRDYFASEHRDPTLTEIRMIDTYWSDHCRHTTFLTTLDAVDVRKAAVEKAFQRYLAARKTVYGDRERPMNLMDIATIGGKYLKKIGQTPNIDVSEEINACSIKIDVDVDGVKEPWLLMFKNETHNHPTEIEPFGGASTCLGGAIRDPLSGRSYVYQAMRVTGAGDIYQPVGETLAGKLPQRVISRKAAAGYSSYGNQIGLATTHVREIYHPDYVAKRLEVGAVVGAVKAENVRRETPAAGDVVLLLGGRTGRDGIGGATGSSKEHNTKSLETCSSEVQKGNAPEERKLERLFRRPEVTRLIKKSNDFGAGGVSVAIGELTDGLDIYLDRVPTKYDGLNATELAISESQERMAVVVERADMERFMDYCREENIEVTHVADVTDTRRMRMYNRDRLVVDLSREFIDSAGAAHYAEAEIGAVEACDPFVRKPQGATLAERMEADLADDNVVSQKGLVEMFDSTIGASTVLLPFGGRTQGSETQVSVQKLPVEGYTETASIMAYGYNPFLTSWSPYHGAAYAVVEACAKVVAAGAEFGGMRFSYQEYFERMHTARSWGKPLAALLGALRMQVELGLPSIGGKDSMSGTFQQINVPPMLMAFGITTVDARRVISTDLKEAGHTLYLLKHTPKANRMPDTAALRTLWNYASERIAAGRIVAGYAVGFGGVAEALAKMAFGNGIGAEVELPEEALFAYDYGSIVVESTVELDAPFAVRLGRTTADEALTVNGERMPLDTLRRANSERFARIYPDRGANRGTVMESTPAPRTFVYGGEAVEHPVAYLPVFPGTNCDYDTARAFRRAGAEVETTVFCNLSAEAIFRSIREMKEHIRRCHIFVLSGGFSSGDEPDGSGKFIANVLNNKDIAEEIHALLDRGGLILGICNGFQALVKSGLLPYGRLGCVTKDSPTLFRNDINRHVSQIVTTRVASTASPWLSSFSVGDLHSIAVSHGEGKFVVGEQLARRLFERGQVAFQYAGPDGHATAEAPCNPNGSFYAIEGIVSEDGRILGKMGHTERYGENLFKNICGEKRQPIFENAVAYFRKRN